MSQVDNFLKKFFAKLEGHDKSIYTIRVTIGAKDDEAIQESGGADMGQRKCVYSLFENGTIRKYKKPGTDLEKGDFTNYGYVEDVSDTQYRIKGDLWDDANQKHVPNWVDKRYVYPALSLLRDIMGMKWDIQQRHKITNFFISRQAKAKADDYNISIEDLEFFFNTNPSGDKFRITMCNKGKFLCDNATGDPIQMTISDFMTEASM